MTKFVLQTIFAIALISAFAFFTKAQTQISPANNEQPKVVKAVAPKFPPAAKATNTSGEVVVQVEIKKDGSVNSAKVLSGQKFLQKVSEIAAKLWLFDPTETKRKINLSFVYEINLQAKNKYADQDVIFNPPYQIKLIYYPDLRPSF